MNDEVPEENRASAACRVCSQGEPQDAPKWAAGGEDCFPGHLLKRETTCAVITISSNRKAMSQSGTSRLREMKAEDAQKHQDN